MTLVVTPDVLRNTQQAIESALLTLLDSAETRARFGAAGRHLIEKNYSLSAVAEKLNALYRRFASQQKRR